MNRLQAMFDSKAAKFRAEKWFWVAHLPVILVLYFFFLPLWNAISVLYLTLISVYAIIKALSSAEQAAEAAQAVVDNSENSAS